VLRSVRYSPARLFVAVAKCFVANYIEVQKAVEGGASWRT